MPENIPENNTCEHCLNSEPYVCDIIYCEYFDKPTHRKGSCDHFRRTVDDENS